MGFNILKFLFGSNPDRVKDKATRLVEERKVLENLYAKQRFMAAALQRERPKNDTTIAINELRTRQNQAKEQIEKYAWEIRGLNRKIASKKNKYKKLTNQDLMI